MEEIVEELYKCPNCGGGNLTADAAEHKRVFVDEDGAVVGEPSDPTHTDFTGTWSCRDCGYEWGESEDDARRADMLDTLTAAEAALARLADIAGGSPDRTVAGEFEDGNPAEVALRKVREARSRMQPPSFKRFGG